MTLRLFWTTGILIIALATLLTALALMRTTDDLHEATRFIHAGSESIYLSEELDNAFLEHRQRVILSGIRTEMELFKEIHATTEEMRSLLRALNEFISSPEEARVVAAIEESLASYYTFLERAFAGRLGSDPGVLERAATVQENIERLVEVNRGQILAAFSKATRQNSQSDRLGMLVIALLVASVGLMTIVTHRAVYGPIRNLDKSIRRFSAGDWEAKARPFGVKELCEIAAVFNDLTERLGRVRKNQLRFLASIAHDLKNPLNAIALASDLMRTPHGASPEKREELADVVQRQVRVLERMVGDLLDGARIEAGEFDFRKGRHDLRPVVQSCAKLFEHVSSVHILSVQVPDEPVLAEFDEARLGQVVNNLLSNAIKYSPHGGRVDVTLEHREGRALVRVSDAGMGVSPAEVETIFEPFRRSASTRDTLPGVGLGLFVTRKIMSAHGGGISVENRSGGGATFVAWLPACPSSG